MESTRLHERGDVVKSSKAKRRRIWLRKSVGVRSVGVEQHFDCRILRSANDGILRCDAFFSAISNFPFQTHVFQQHGKDDLPLSFGVTLSAVREQCDAAMDTLPFIPRLQLA